MGKKILIIDDDEKLIDLLTEFLDNYGFISLSAIHPQKGMDILHSESIDAVILDVMLPEMNGFDVCKRIRKEFSVPIIMLTARGHVMDRVLGLELGADDYLPKPFEPRELVARLQSILRRTHATNKESKNERMLGALALNLTKQEVYVNDQKIELTTTEFEALVLLTTHPGEVYNRDQILEHLRGMECDAFNRSVDITMSRLRQKLGDKPKSPQFIKTIWGSGYKFIGGQS